jgi:hypothetical protein
LDVLAPVERDLLELRLDELLHAMRGGGDDDVAAAPLAPGDRLPRSSS